MYVCVCLQQRCDTAELCCTMYCFSVRNIGSNMIVSEGVSDEKQKQRLKVLIFCKDKSPNVGQQLHELTKKPPKTTVNDQNEAQALYYPLCIGISQYISES